MVNRLPIGNRLVQPHSLGPSLCLGILRAPRKSILWRPQVIRLGHVLDVPESFIAIRFFMQSLHTLEIDKVTVQKREG